MMIRSRMFHCAVYHTHTCSVALSRPSPGRLVAMLRTTGRRCTLSSSVWLMILLAVWLHRRADLLGSARVGENDW
jgi:hypothetical protein